MIRVWGVKGFYPFVVLEWSGSWYVCAVFKSIRYRNLPHSLHLNLLFNLFRLPMGQPPLCWVSHFPLWYWYLFDGKMTRRQNILKAIWSKTIWLKGKMSRRLYDEGRMADGRMSTAEWRTALHLSAPKMATSPTSHLNSWLQGKKEKNCQKFGQSCSTCPLSTLLNESKSRFVLHLHLHSA